MTPNTAKMLLGGLGGVCFVALLAFHKLLQLEFDTGTQVMIFGAAVGAFGVAGHGALKTPTEPK